MARLIRRLLVGCLAVDGCHGALRRAVIGMISSYSPATLRIMPAVCSPTLSFFLSTRGGLGRTLWLVTWSKKPGASHPALHRRFSSGVTGISASRRLI
jgi:hypothetical protein